MSPPDYSKPFFLFVDASQDGKGAALRQRSDNKDWVPSDYIENDPNWTDIHYFSKAWTASEAKRPPFFLETSAYLWSKQQAKPYLLYSPFEVRMFSDQAAIQWSRHIGHGPASDWALLLDSMIPDRHYYIPSKINSLADLMSRYPMIGHRTLAATGIDTAFTNLLSVLPTRLKDSKSVCVYAGKDTIAMSKIVQRWRHPKNPIVKARYNMSNFDLTISVLNPTLAPTIVYDFIQAKHNAPHVFLLPTDLLPQIKSRGGSKEPSNFVQSEVSKCGKIFMMHPILTWMIFNVAECEQLCECYSAITNVTTWKGNQDVKSEERSHYVLKDELYYIESQDGLLRLIVPTKEQKGLVMRTHESMQHLGPAKVYQQLRKYYYWKFMQRDIHEYCSKCSLCAVAKATKLKATKLYRAITYEKPRAAYAIDFYGMTTDDYGYSNVLSAIDCLGRNAVFTASKTRTKEETATIFTDKVIYRYGVPEVVISDSAPELCHGAIKLIANWLNITQISSLGYNPIGTVERPNLYLGRCFHIMPDEIYDKWSSQLPAIDFAYNTAHHNSIDCTPAEVQHGTNLKTITAPTFENEKQLENLLATAITVKGSMAKQIAIIKASAEAYIASARSNDTYVKELTAELLNEKGHLHEFKVGDAVTFYKPPSANVITRRNRKAKHLPQYSIGVVIERLSNSSYKIREVASGNEFARTASLIRKTNASQVLDVDDNAGNDNLTIGEILACKDIGSDTFWLAKVTNIADGIVTLHYMSSKSTDRKKAKFYPVYMNPKTNYAYLKTTARLPRNATPYQGTIEYDDLLAPNVLVARDLRLTKNYILDKSSYIVLSKAGQHATL